MQRLRQFLQDNKHNSGVR